MKTKCSLQARIPYLWHANASSFLIIPQVVALETAKQLLDLRDPVWESKKPLQPQHSDPWRLQRYGRRTVRKTWKRGRKWTKLSYIAQFFKKYNTIHVDNPFAADGKQALPLRQPSSTVFHLREDSPEMLMPEELTSSAFKIRQLEIFLSSNRLSSVSGQTAWNSALLFFFE